MAKEVRLDLYVESEEQKNRIKNAAASHMMSISAYCVKAIEEKLARDEEAIDPEKRKVFLPEWTS
jgi:hypothetical protein